MSGILTGNGGPLTTITDNKEFFNGFGINDRGTVAFSNFEGIFTSNGRSITTIADTSGPFSSFDQDSTTINNSGTVVFQATSATGVSGLFSSIDGSTTTIVDNSGPFESFFDTTELNNNATVVFRASLDSGSEGVFTSSGGTATTIVDNSGLFSTFDNVAINDRGTVAFRASLDAGQPNVFADGIYTGPDPIADKVLAVGDSLFGSTVTNLFLSPYGLNNSGQIALLADITDGNGSTIRTVLRANPVPEPSSALGILAFSALGVISRLLRK